MCGPKSGLKPWPVSCHCHTIKTPWTRHGAPTLSIMLTRFGQTVRQIIVIMRKCLKKQHSPRDSYKLRGKKTEYRTSSAYEIGRRKLAADNLAIHMFNGKNLAIFSVWLPFFIARSEPDTNQSLCFAGSVICTLLLVFTSY